MFCILIILITPPNPSHIHTQINPHSYKFLSSSLPIKTNPSCSSVLFYWKFIKYILIMVFPPSSLPRFFSPPHPSVWVCVCSCMCVCYVCVCYVCVLCFAVVATAVHAAADIDEDDNNDYLVLICLLKYSWVCDLPLTCDWLTRSYTPRGEWLSLSQKLTIPNPIWLSL